MESCFLEYMVVHPKYKFAACMKDRWTKSSKTDEEELFKECSPKRVCTVLSSTSTLVYSCGVDYSCSRKCVLLHGTE